MNDNNETVGLGVTFLREDDTIDDEFNEIAQVASISPPQLERNIVEVDDLNPEDQIKKKLPGLVDAGELVVTLNFDVDGEAGHDDLKDDFNSKAEKNYRVQFPIDEEEEEGGYFPIAGIVTGFAPQEIGAEDVFQVQITITATKKSEFVPVSGLEEVQTSNEGDGMHV